MALLYSAKWMFYYVMFFVCDFRSLTGFYRRLPHVRLSQPCADPQSMKFVLYCIHSISKSACLIEYSQYPLIGVWSTTTVLLFVFCFYLLSICSNFLKKIVISTINRCINAKHMLRHDYSTRLRMRFVSPDLIQLLNSLFED